ncbi:YvrJ family protein [Sediminibacillus dalangtanensis]|uniref:YvrJ family protein n=1 Tax=Sediminibacillus dalangtanensis TaxID=2729421 RepID=A0ABX7VXU9_9BACI|nr:YvrJ family protein [Sediminibacillus dalangtanensis]
MTTWMALISNLGFPVVLVLYLLIRFEKRIMTLAESIDKLRDALGTKNTR